MWETVKLVVLGCLHLHALGVVNGVTSYLEAWDQIVNLIRMTKFILTVSFVSLLNCFILTKISWWQVLSKLFAKVRLIDAGIYLLCINYRFSTNMLQILFHIAMRFRRIRCQKLCVMSIDISILTYAIRTFGSIFWLVYHNRKVKPSRKPKIFVWLKLAVKILNRKTIWFEALL